MPRLPREDFIHVAVRAHLKRQGWKLLAGQFPGGSDDELNRLYVRDPALARDRSPDPRRHSTNSYVPDLIALRGPHLLLVEMKPAYSERDLAKLRTMTTERCVDLCRAIRDGLGISLPDCSSIMPALGFSILSSYPDLEDVHMLLVEDLERVLEDPPLP